jgi:hypothetical protein
MVEIISDKQWVSTAQSVNCHYCLAHWWEGVRAAPLICLLSVLQTKWDKPACVKPAEPIWLVRPKLDHFLAQIRY